MATAPKLSLCLAVYNEKDFIHYALDSAYDIADEVIIVDGGSDDGTLDIIKSYGSKIKVYHEDNPPMFHINKQKALDKANGEWILQLDADEALSPELKTELLTIVKTTPTPPSKGGEVSPVAYWMPRKNYFLGRFLTKGGIYPDYTIRLYRRGKAHLPCKSVHENVEVDGEIGYLKHDLLHYADPDFSRYMSRWNRYTSMDAAMILKKKEHVGFFSYFVWQPLKWFFSTYFRHRGYKDGFSGFVFALFSAIRFWGIYIKVRSAKSSHTA